MKWIFFFLLACVSTVGCQRAPKKIVQRSDVMPYLQPVAFKALDQCNEEIDFWQQRREERTTIMKQAGLYAKRFKLTGNVHDLRRSDSLYVYCQKRYGRNHVEPYQMLAANAITQHQFPEARNYIQQALELGNKKHTSLMMLVDVLLEMGYVDIADWTLRDFTNQQAFAWRIRAAKLKDKKGDLPGAIKDMEQALDRVKNNPALASWVKSNLADMYGHAGRIADAYRLYLEVLSVDETNDYCLKGIAWIALSHDHNTAFAREVVNHLQASRPLPEYALMLAEMAVVEQEHGEQWRQTQNFISLTSTPAYGRMYTRHQALLAVDVLANPARTITLAQQEIDNRPCPQSYDLLGWGHYHAGHYDKALAIAQTYVEGATTEPDALYHLGVIYQANGHNDKARQYLEEALEGAFELGPRTEMAIRRSLASIDKEQRVLFISTDAQ